MWEFLVSCRPVNSIRHQNKLYRVINCREVQLNKSANVTLYYNVSSDVKMKGFTTLRFIYEILREKPLAV